jgi:hypothetical protein
LDVPAELIKAPKSKLHGGVEMFETFGFWIHSEILLLSSCDIWRPWIEWTARYSSPRTRAKSQFPWPFLAFWARTLGHGQSRTSAFGCNGWA